MTPKTTNTFYILNSAVCLCWWVTFFTRVSLKLLSPCNNKIACRKRLKLLKNIQKGFVVHCGLISSICIRKRGSGLVIFAVIKPEVSASDGIQAQILTQAGSILILPSFQATEASATLPFFSFSLK